ncbi:MAG: hypothetical protein V3T72_16640 [Thermoanaerobaculia bacterium]
MGRRAQKKRRSRSRTAPARAAASPAGNARPASPAAASAAVTGLGIEAGIVANLLIFATLAVARVLHSASSDLYYLAVQEDEFLEWATFWAFIAAAAAGAFATLRQWRGARRVPWFLAGVSWFCFLVAMEEISWGQRVFGYRPPTYFLAENFQQELNFHNVMATDLRMLGFKLITLGYGVALPVLAWVPAIGRLFSRLAIVAPPWLLIPSFLISYLVYEDRPWSFTGEWIEMMLGLGFLFAAIDAIQLFGSATRRRRRGSLAWVAVSCLVALGLAAINTAITRSQRDVDPVLLDNVQTELDALQRDFLAGGKIRSHCNLHKRVFTFMEQYGHDDLLEGEFAALTARGLAQDRADFFLDPWNYPYWIRDRCSDDKSRRITVVYSFGPNRIRDSTRWEILGDDVAAFIYKD